MGTSLIAKRVSIVLCVFAPLLIAGCESGVTHEGKSDVPDLGGMTIEEAMDALAAVDLRVGIVTTRAVTNLPPNPPVIVLRQLPLPGEEIPEDSGVNIEVSVPEDPDRFMTLVQTPTCSDTITSDCIADTAFNAADYYGAVDPNGERTTYADWLAVNGFGARGGGVEANAIYFNEFDLGFGRNMSMRFTSPDQIAYVVTNHRTADEAFVDSDSPINIVAMEYSVTPSVGPDPFIKFFTFDENGNRIEAVELDDRGDKFQPVMCMSCHGGFPTGFDLDNYPSAGDLGVPGFIPFDMDSFVYSDNFEQLSRQAQEEQFRRLNAGVLSSWQSLGGRAIARWDTPTVPIPDGAPHGVSLALEVKDAEGTIRDANLVFGSAKSSGLVHADMSSVDILLTSPRGTTAVVYSGEVGGDCANVRFDDEADFSVREVGRSGGSLSGIVAPSDSLAVFDGEDPNGNWQLTVIDHATGNAGRVNEWSLDLRLNRGSSISPVEELIQGWYGTPTGTTPEGLPTFANNFDGTFIPDSWTTSDESIQLYDRVVERSCRTCHVMQHGRKATFSTFANFDAFKSLTEARVFVQGTMPDALRTYHNFWTGLAVVDNERVPVIPTGPEVLAEYLGRPLSGPGMPFADAGADRTVTLGTADVAPVELNGSESFFADTYEWAWDTGSVATPILTASANSPLASFTPVVPGEYRLRLVVYKGTTPSVPDQIVITVDNPGPTALAGIVGPSSIQPGVLEATVDVQLDGTGSTDPNDSVAQYIWTPDTTVNAASPDPDDVAMPTVTLPANSQHRFLLQVVDSFGRLSANVSQQSVSVSEADNGPPTAAAGSDQVVALNIGETTGSAQLDGSASTDPENQALSYIWEAVTAGAPDPDDVAAPSVVLPRTTSTDTVYTFRLTVVDDKNAQNTDLINVTVRRGGPSFNNEVSGMLGTSCSACHSGGYIWNATGTANDMFTSISPFVNTATPSASAALAEPASDIAVANCTGILHGGGTVAGFDWCAFQTGGGTLNDLLTTPVPSLPVGVQRYATVLRWITDGGECTDCP